MRKLIPLVNALLLVSIELTAFKTNALTLSTADKTLCAAAEKAYKQYIDLDAGKNADYIPILAKVPSDLFAISIATVDGLTISIGDSDSIFTIQSLAKPFTAALLMEQRGGKFLLEKINVEPTGQPFNSKLALEILPSHTGNPLVNAGAIATISLLTASSEPERWNIVYENMNRFAGRKLPFVHEAFQSEYDHSENNRALAYMLESFKKLGSNPEEALKVYTKQGAVGITSLDLSLMGATLANRGIHPWSKSRIIMQKNVTHLLAIMTMNGLYTDSGAWQFTVGLPSKSGVGGGILSIVPEKFAIAVFSPRLNEAGNSIRAMRVIESISNDLNLNIYTGDDSHGRKNNNLTSSNACTFKAY